MDNKIIRDSLHGYISLPAIIFSEIIDTPIFQRLKRIEQTSMRPLYPSAHHDRFIHSLGVYYLGEKALDGLINNIETNDYYIGKELIWKKYGLLFKIACLLHDCAHAPFSHSFEKYYLGEKNEWKWNNIKDILKGSLKNAEDFTPLSKHSQELYEHAVEELFYSDPAPHEVFSAIVVVQYFLKRIKTVFEKSGEFQIKTEHIEFIQRAILGMKYDIEKINAADRDKFNVLNCLIQLLNSKSFDVDKLDYIMRDSAASGTNNLSVDVVRILSALTIIETHEFKENVSIDDDINNSVIFRDLDTEMGENTQKKCEINLSLENIKIDGKIRGYIKITEGTIKEIANKNNKYTDGSEHEFEKETNITGTLDKANIKGYFVGNLSSTASGAGKGFDGFIKCKIDGSVCGKVIGKIKWTVKGTTHYEIGYNKSALSIIEDTITARNRLYMWIYAHHKVTYIDYLLRNAVLVSLLDKPHKDRLVLSDLEQEATQELEKLLDLNIFDKNDPNFLLDDSKFITMITSDMNQKNEFAQKYLSRTKEYSVWKNYAEYNMFFNDLSLTERENLWLLLFDKEKKQNKYKEGNLQLFTSSILNDYDGENANEFVWIKPSGYKISKISTDDTYLLFKESVRRLKDVMIRDKITEEYVDDYYFYLYTSTQLDYNQKLELIDFLKNKVRENNN
ncbi:MAG: HD domain-containing protein [Prevotellaceae bacterium]|jgi:HD superfamily phosphohydrolase|nr:HD domain-containing protein [Prevotellaceae bacterium]